MVKVLIPMSMIFTSIPPLLAGLLLSYIFAFLLKWFPQTYSYGFTVKPGLTLEFIANVIHHGTLPAMAIVLVTFRLLGAGHARHDGHH